MFDTPKTAPYHCQKSPVHFWTNFQARLLIRKTAQWRCDCAEWGFV